MFPIWFAAAVTSSAIATSDDARAFRYVVRQHDTLSTFSERFLLPGNAMSGVLKRNRIAHPRKLITGEVLFIPYSLMRWTPVSARVSSYRGSVMIAGKVVGVGAVVDDGATVSTARDSFVAIGFPDGTIATMPSNSTARIVSLRRYVLTGEVDRRFLIQRGGSEWQVAPAKSPGDRFEVRTPVAVAAVRGTEFRVTFDDAGARGGAGVVKGEVGFATTANAEPTALPKGFGAVTDRAGVVDKRILLSAPALRQGYDVQLRPTLDFAVIPVPGAKSYIVEIAHDSGFFDSVARVTVPSEVISLPTIDDGTYFLRASAVDDAGLQGFGATFSFKRRLSVLAVNHDEQDRLRFSWTPVGEGLAAYRFVLSLQKDLSRPLIDVPALTTSGIAIGALGRGKYYWGVTAFMRDGSQTSQVESFEAGGK